MLMKFLTVFFGRHATTLRGSMPGMQMCLGRDNCELISCFDDSAAPKRSLSWYKFLIFPVISRSNTFPSTKNIFKSKEKIILHRHNYFSNIESVSQFVFWKINGWIIGDSNLFPHQIRYIFWKNIFKIT